MAPDKLPPGVFSATDVALTSEKNEKKRKQPAALAPSPEDGRKGTGVRAGASQITALEPQQKRRGRLNVFVDGKFTLGLFEEVALALGLHVGQRITPGRLAEIAAAETLRRAKEDAYRLLSFRPRSEKEIEDRLRRHGYDEENVVAAVLASLRASGYVDDAAFAETWVEARGKTRGRRALAHELRQKGIAGDLAAETLREAKTDEAELAAARAAACKRVGERPGDKSREAQAKLAAFLQRRGFGWDVIRPILSELYAADVAAGADDEEDNGPQEFTGPALYNEELPRA